MSGAPTSFADHRDPHELCALHQQLLHLTSPQSAAATHATHSRPISSPLRLPQTPAPSRKQPHHVPCLGASDPSTTESVRGRVQKGKRAGMRKRACDGGKCTGGHTKMREGDCKNMSKIGCEVSGLLTIGKAWPFRIGLWKW